MSHYISWMVNTSNDFTICTKNCETMTLEDITTKSILEKPQDR